MWTSTRKEGPGGLARDGGRDLRGSRAGAQPNRDASWAEPIEQAPGWVRALATPAHELAAMRAEALEEIAKWRRGEPSRVMTFEELFAWLDALDATGEDADAAPDAAHPGPPTCNGC